jgi:hypothetical protein
MYKVILKNGEKLEINKEMFLINDTLGRPSKFKKELQFKLFINYVEKHWAGYDIYTNNGVISIEQPKDYILINLYHNNKQLADGSFLQELLINALPKYIWYDGSLLDVNMIIDLPTKNEQWLNDYLIYNDDGVNRDLLERIFGHMNITAKKFRELKKELLEKSSNWVSILEFREAVK